MKKQWLLSSLIMTLIVVPAAASIGQSFVKEPDPGIHYRARPLDLPITGEPRFSSQNHFNYLNYGSVYDTNRGEGVTVAIIDSGINTTHQDFFDGVYTNISDKSAHIEELGEVYSNIRIRTVADYGLSVIEDPLDNGHGTNVAGTIGALINGVGSAGVAPEVTLMVIKTDYWFTEIDEAIYYAADNGADVINMSIGAYEETFIDGFGDEQEGYEGTATYFQDAIDYAYNNGVTIVAAAGNEKTNVKSYPASNNHVIGAGALEANSGTQLAYYSNFGLDNVDVVAPGAVYVADVGSASSFVSTLGTSFASPIVASAAALYKAKVPLATPAEIEQKLKDTSDDLGTSGVDAMFGYGRVNLTNLLTDIPVTAVSLSDEDVMLHVGDTHSLVVTISPTNASNKNVLYLSDNEAIASVDDTTGLITATGIGSTTITVITEDGMFEDTCTIEVVSLETPIPVKSITLNTTTLDLAVGTTSQLTVTVNPSNATNKDVTFSSTNTNIASVSSTGLIEAKSAGSVTITATSVDGNKIATCTVEVLNYTEEDMTYTFTNKSWAATPSNWVSGLDGLGYLNNGVQVSTGVSGANARSPQSFSNITGITIGYATNASSGAGSIEIRLLDTPSSSGTSLGSFSVTTAGGTSKRDTTMFIPTSVDSGYIKIIVTTNVNSIYICDIDIAYNVEVVEPIAVTSVEFTNGPLALLTGATTTVTYRVLPLDATNKNVTFTSLDPAVVTINSSGLVSALQAGVTQVRVTTADGGYTALCDVTVTDPIVYEKELTLDTSQFKKAYTFKEALDISHLSASYRDTSGTISIIAGSALTLSSGNTSQLGNVTLTFSYEGVSDSVTIMVTNVGAVQTGGTPISANIPLNGADFSPSLTTTATTYTSISQGGLEFAAGSMRNILVSSNTYIMINSGGYLYNKTSLGPITNISLSYAVGGSASSVQKFMFADTPITASGTANTTLSTSTGGTTSQVSVSNKQYFRLDVSNKNLQALITITYQSGIELSFTASEQASAYAEYFMNVTHEQCLDQNVESATWAVLQNEYEAMVSDAKTLITTSNDYVNLRARYQIIVIGYDYNDYLMVVAESGRGILNTAINSVSTAALIIMSIILPTLMSLSFLVKGKRKQH